MRKCLNCDTELTGKQKKYCSNICGNIYYLLNNMDSENKRKKEYRDAHKKEIKIYNKQYNKKNRDVLIANKKDSYRKNIEKIKKYNEENKDRANKYYQENREDILKRVKRRYQDNREEMLNYSKAYIRRNRKKIREYHKAWEQKQPLYRLGHNISSGMRHTLKTQNLSKNRKHWENIVGYLVQDLKEHLEGLFQEGMTWDNYGEWHIDHIIPRVFFEYTSLKDVEFRYCWSLDNLQPLWAKDNLSKGGRL